jgi:uncharacterized membrane protein YhhN
MNETYLLAFAALLLVGHLYYERGKRTLPALFTKTFVSLLFVGAAITQPHPLPDYYQMVLIALVLSVAGDVLLAIPGQRTFLAGLVSFLTGHIAYVVAFFGLAAPGIVAGIGAVALAGIAFVVYRWLAPHLGDMRIPVIAYMVVISVMVIGALSVMTRTDLPLAGRTLVLAGAVAFFASDLFVAKDRFVDGAFSNRVIGLPLYYGAQFMLAFSVGFIG